MSKQIAIDGPNPISKMAPTVRSTRLSIRSSNPAAKLSLAVCISAAIFSSFASAEQLRRVQLLEEQVSVLEEQQAETNRINNVITVNGFFTLSAGMASNDAGYAGYDETLDYVPETKVGLQASFEVTESTFLLLQLVARAEQHYALNGMGFLSHTFDNDLTVRAGRLRVPLYMYSDYLEVNFAQPWLRPPEEVYAVVPVSSYEGIDFVYTIPFDEAEWQFQAYTGVGSDPDEETDFGTDVEYDDVIGLASTFTYNSFSIRASYVMTTLNSGQGSVPGTSTALVNFTDADTSFIGLGASYDDGDLLVVAEWTKSQVDGSGLDTTDSNYSGNWQDVDSAYISVAYRFGDITPYMTYAIMETSDDDERAQAFDDSGSVEEGTLNTVNQIVFDAKRSTYSAGLRYDINANMALKFDVTYSGDFGETDATGGLSGNVINKLGNLAGQSNVIEEDTFVYTTSLNMVF